MVASFFLRSKCALGMSVEIGAIDAEDEHQQHLGVHARRAHVSRLQTIDGGRERLLQLHDWKLYDPQSWFRDPQTEPGTIRATASRLYQGTTFSRAEECAIRVGLQLLRSQGLKPTSLVS